MQLVGNTDQSLQTCVYKLHDGRHVKDINYIKVIGQLITNSNQDLGICYSSLRHRARMLIPNQNQVEQRPSRAFGRLGGELSPKPFQGRELHSVSSAAWVVKSHYADVATAWHTSGSNQCEAYLSQQIQANKLKL